MQVHHQSGILEGSIEDSAVATIRATPEMFSMLSKLYSDPVLAVVREIYSNAIDSHVQARKVDVQPEVKLPTRFDTTFYIRDFGVGLSDKQIKKLYLSYGYSSKNDSNDQIGGFGVGSKSPFAYTDTFNVESFYNGKHYTYLIYFNEKRIPALSLVNEQDTTEPNGLKVSLAAKPEDTQKFWDSATKLFPHATIKPNFIDGSLTYDLPRFIVDQPEYKVLENEHAQSLIIMGGVPYNSHKKVYGHPIWLTVNIGDVSVTPSREEIQLDERTNKFLDAKVKEIEPKIIQYVEDYVSSAANYWEACYKYTKLRNFVKHSVGLTAPQYKGKNLKTRFRFEKDKVTLKYYYLTYRGKLQENSRSELDIDTNDGDASYLYLADTYNKHRLKHFIANNKSSLTTGQYFYTISFANAVAQQEFEDETSLDASTFKKLSDLPKVARVAGTTQYRNQLKKYTGHIAYANDGRSNWVNFTDNGEDAYYILISDGFVEDISRNVFSFCVKYLNYLDDKAVILGAQKSGRSKLLKELAADNVEPISTLYEAVKLELANDPDLVEAANAANYFSNYSNISDKKFIDFIGELSTSNKEVVDFQTKTKNWLSKNKKAAVISDYLDLFGINNQDKYAEIITEFKKKWPIVDWLSKAYNNKQEKEIITYLDNTL